MSISAKRRETEVFSLAFLDCICCGFGAMILVFILTINKKTSSDQVNVEELRQRVKQIQSQVTTTQGDIDRLNRLSISVASCCRTSTK